MFAGVRVFLRGKAHAEWKVTRGGERRTVKEDQYFMDEKALVWGKGNNVIICHDWEHLVTRGPGATSLRFAI